MHTRRTAIVYSHRTKDVVRGEALLGSGRVCDVEHAAGAEPEEKHRPRRDVEGDY